MATPFKLTDGIEREGIPAASTLYRLAGTVTVDGNGAKRRIIAYHRETGDYVGSVMAQSDGSWEISGIPQYGSGNVMVIAQDTETSGYNSGVRDFVTPVLII
ncbi:hypothetical protein DRH14_03380 [Candidatus Shapirobacteria bacterium]|nr:MAG: hypothetical protein DRH14_03380 [Candidatus Shapirobacteria bacterium]